MKRSLERTSKVKKKPFFLFVLPPLLIVSAVLIFPILFVLFTSFTNRQLVFLGNLRFVGFRNYIWMFQDKLFWHTLKLQLIFIVIALPIELILGFFLALLMNNEIKGFKIFRALLLLPVFVLPVLSGLTWRLMLQPEYGVLAYLFKMINFGPEAWLADNTYAFVAVIVQDVWRMTPFMFMLIYAGLSSMPSEFIEAAQIDGANFWKRVSHIIVPYLKPVLGTALLMRLIDALRIFSEVYVMTYGGPGNSTLLLSLYVNRVGFDFGQLGQSSAIAVFLLIVALSLSYFIVRGTLRGQFES